MDIWCVILGYLVSTIGGAFVLWLVVDIVGWSYLQKVFGIKRKARGSLSVTLGIVERGLYTTALIIYAPEWIAVWLAIKVAGQWRRSEQEGEKAAYNLFLIGNGLSVLFGLIGAWIALGSLPSFST